MKRVLVWLAVLSIPVLAMLRVVQGYRYTAALEESERLESAQIERLEENRRILAGIAVYDAPARIYRVGSESLGLVPTKPDQVIQVRLPDGTEVFP